MAAGSCRDEDKDQQPRVACESVASSSREKELAQGPRTWGNDRIQEQEKRRTWQADVGWKADWTWSLQEAWLRAWRGGIKEAAAAFARLPIWKWTPWTRKHLFAVFLVLATAVAPMCILGTATAPNDSSMPFSSIFADKVIGCGGSFGGRPENSTVTGIEKLFALDVTFGAFSFAQAKSIDILWDVALGRSLQLLAAWAAYIVFCDALLKVIERHPASFAIFQRIALEGPKLTLLWTLMVELWAVKSRRTKALFFYMFWATAYVLSVPIVLGAMTGYDSTAIAWVDLDGSNNLVPGSALQLAWVIKGTTNDTWSEPGCADYDLYYTYSRISGHRLTECDCKLPNGTIYPAPKRLREYGQYGYWHVSRNNCTYNYANNTQTWQDTDSSFPSATRTTYLCNSTVPVTVKGKTYDAQDLQTTIGHCYNSVGYNDTYLSDKSRCLPDTANQTYQWGFSTLLSGLFVFVTTAWVLSMYVLWLDAQHGSRLVRTTGYRMTPLRAAFAMAKAASLRTGLHTGELVRADSAPLERKLYGGKGSSKTTVGYSLFAQDHEADDDEDGWLAAQRGIVYRVHSARARSDDEVPAGSMHDDALSTKPLVGEARAAG